MHISGILFCFFLCCIMLLQITQHLKLFFLNVKPSFTVGSHWSNQSNLTHFSCFQNSKRNSPTYEKLTFLVCVLQLPSLQNLELSRGYDPNVESLPDASYPQIHLKCTSGHPTLAKVTLSKLCIQGLSLQRLACLESLYVHMSDESAVSLSQWDSVALSKDLTQRKSDRHLWVRLPTGMTVSRLHDEGDSSWIWAT